LPPYDQTKLIRVLRGKILDVVVDIRKGSPTFGKTYNKVLSAKNKSQLFIPKGFAHGFSVLSKKAEVLYKCDGNYNKESEAGIIYNDPALNIDWGIPIDDAIISEKDKLLPMLKDCKSSFEYGR
jgi:dTDP-4-dehydrorhamnose 3,5-epimerase